MKHTYYHFVIGESGVEVMVPANSIEEAIEKIVKERQMFGRPAEMYDYVRWYTT